MRMVPRITIELRPSLLDHLGLWDAIDWLAKVFRSRQGSPFKVEARALALVAAARDLSRGPGRSIMRERAQSIGAHKYTESRRRHAGQDYGALPSHAHSHSDRR